MADKVINVDIKTDVTGIKNLKTELRETKEALQQATDPKEMERLVQKAAQLQDKMADVNEQIAVFASGSKYEQVSNSLGQVGNAIANLDFEKAQDRAQAFATAAGKITFGDAIKSVKQLGQTFITIGKALLTNPLFLIGAIIALVVIGIVKLLDKLGFLKKMFEVIGIAIDWVINLFKSLLDWMGLTDFAGEEAAENQIKRNEALIESEKKKTDEIVGGLDHEINKRKANGEDTEALEKEKLRVITTALQEELKARLKIAAASALLYEKDSEEFKAAMANVETAKNAFIQAQRDMEVADIAFNFKRREEAKKTADKLNEIEKKKFEEAEKIRLAALAKEAADIANLMAQIETLENARYDSKLSLEQLEINATRDKYFGLIEAAKQYGLDTAQLEEDQQAVISEIQDRYAKERGDKRIQDEKDLRAFMNEIELNERTKQFELLAMQEEEDILKLQDFLSRKLLTEEEYQIALTELQKGYTEQREAFDRAEAQKTADEKMAIAQQYTGAATGLMSSIAGFASAMNAKETKDKEAQAKKQFKIDKTVALVTAAINTALAITKAAPNPVMMGLAAVTGALSIATIASKQYQSGGGGGSAPSLPSPSQVQQEAANPSLNLFGSGGNANQLTPNETMEGNQNITVTAVVSETEVTGTQDKIKRMNANAEL